MKIIQKLWTKDTGWKDMSNEGFSIKANLVLVFGKRELLEESSHLQEIRQVFPEANIVMVSSAGDILDTNLYEDSITLTAIEFKSTKIKCRLMSGITPESSEDFGRKISESLDPEKLVHLLVFADGKTANGSALIAGINSNLPIGVSMTGGMAGDGADFVKTIIGLDDTPSVGNVVTVAFYGDSLKVGYGSLGGWDAFGLERIITKSKNNILYELDNRSALSLYKEYLGDRAKDLPSSGLLFPIKLTIKNHNGEHSEVVRTILGINEKEGSMTFAGDMPEGSRAMFMRANFERIIDAANGASNLSLSDMNNERPDLAILISCIGRKLVLGSRVEEELEAVRKSLGEDPFMTGFYSYGEFCPTVGASNQCSLHNQTMTITVFKEN